MSRPRRRPATTAVVGGLVGAAVLAMLGVACGGDDGGDTETFSAGLQANLEQIARPEIDTAEEAEAQIRLYRDLAGDAPLTVEQDWGALLASLEAANEVEPDDPASEQRAAAAAFAAERSAVFITQWVTANCGFDLPPVVTVGDTPTTTTTLPGATTTVAG